ncbi:MAG: hypothetical protein Q9163_001151 [Psora crenata]
MTSTRPSNAPIAPASQSQVLTPAASTTVNKPVPIAPTPGSTLYPTAFTNKEWVIPPRPKPGRKRAGDAPPTKRKAQNRDAQRAFRERRAAKVGELEEQLKETERTAKEEREGLIARVEQLQKDLQQYTDLLSSLQQRYRELEMVCGQERQLRQITDAEIQTLRKVTQGGMEAVALPKRRDRRHEYLVEQQGVGQEQIESVLQGDTAADSVTCGRCNGSDRCQCIEEAFEMTGIGDHGGNDASLKRLHSPLSSNDHKRMCQSPAVNADEGNEIDFTAQYASQRPHDSATADSGRVSVSDTAQFEPCGFCKDGDICICAALAEETQQQPSEAVPTKEGLSASCTSNPGSCAQCRSDPASTLFCKTLAATRSAAHIVSKDTTSDGPEFSQEDAKRPKATLTGPTLTCADAFVTLSRHRAFAQARAELGTWVSQLAAVPGANTEGKTAFEIEAASVMSVLQFFDTRLGDTRRAEGIGGNSQGDEEIKENKTSLLGNGDVGNSRSQSG